jgi:putative isomerase
MRYIVRVGATVLAALVLAGAAGPQERITPRPPSPAYQRLQADLARGWNTWNTDSVLSYVLMPEGLAVTLGLHYGPYVDRFYPSTRPGETVRPGIRSEDGSYTSVDLSWKGNEFSVESGHDGPDLVVLVKVRRPEAGWNFGGPTLVIETGLLWNRPGEVGREDTRVAARAGNKTVTVQTTGSLVPDISLPVPAATLAVRLQGEIGVSTGRMRSLDEIKGVLARRREEVERRARSFGELGDLFSALRTVLAWNVIYEPEGGRVIVPVSRSWNANWGGYVMFDWDSYFAAAMFSLFNRDLALANAVEVTKGITPLGFIPNWRSPLGSASYDRSQPPVGSLMVREIYRRFPERWFLEEVYDELLAWNRWWPHYRSNRDWLSWGTNDIPPDADRHTAQGAKYESGLDNSPLFDGVPFDGEKSVLELADVGLTSLYAADCAALAEISGILGKKAQQAELRLRGERYRKALARLWDEKSGIFRDLRTDTGVFSDRLSPTNFFPLLARAATARQAARMIRDHYFNPAEFSGEFVMPSISRSDPGFKDNDYWRGRVWAPMNFLVYLGLRNYSLETARRDLVAKSRELLLKSWTESGAVFENYNSVTGRGDDVANSDSFYTWGALLAYLSFLEEGK